MGTFQLFKRGILVWTDSSSCTSGSFAALLHGFAGNGAWPPWGSLWVRLFCTAPAREVAGIHVCGRTNESQSKVDDPLSTWIATWSERNACRPNNPGRSWPPQRDSEGSSSSNTTIPNAAWKGWCSCTSLSSRPQQTQPACRPVRRTCNQSLQQVSVNCS